MPGTPFRSASYNPISSLAAGLLAWGLQSVWVIDPLTGDDAGDGSAASPLKTMGELNSRLCGNFIQQPTTVQLVGDVIDQPLHLMGTRFKLGASLLVNGTRTVVATGRIATVTPIGLSGGAFPWQLTTTGIDWTLQASGAQILFSNGTVGWIRNVVDANNVVIGAVTSLIANTSITPIVGLTFEVASVSRALPAVLNTSAATTGLLTTISVQLQNISFDSGANLEVSGAGVAYAGCELKSNSAIWSNAGVGTLLFRSCRMTLTVALALNSGSGRTTIFGGVIAATTGIPNFQVFSGFNNQQNALTFYRCSYTVLNGNVVSSQGMHFEAVSGTRVLQIDNNGFLATNGNAINGRNCTAGTGIEITNGRLCWIGAGNKPFLGIASGCTRDVRLGGGSTVADYTYAALGLGKTLLALDAIPPTSLILTGAAASSMYQVG